MEVSQQSKLTLSPINSHTVIMLLCVLLLQVTHRIMSYRFMGGNFSASVSARLWDRTRFSTDNKRNGVIEEEIKRLFPDVFWPSSLECNKCRRRGENELAVALPVNRTQSNGNTIKDPSYFRREPMVQFNNASIWLSNFVYNFDLKVIWDENAVSEYIHSVYGFHRVSVGMAACGFTFFCAPI